MSENNLDDRGNTIYPKYVYPDAIKEGDKVKSLGVGVIVNNKDEEDKAMKDAAKGKEPWAAK